MGGVSDAMGKVSEYIANNEDQRNQQMMMISKLMRMLDTGTKRHPRQDTTIQTDLSLLNAGACSNILSMATDNQLNELKMNNLYRIMQEVVQIEKKDINVSMDECIKQFGYMMTEKVKKDVIEKKGPKASAGGNKTVTSFQDFICAVTLTNTNSVSGSRLQLSHYLHRIHQMSQEKHPFA